uniref:Serine peptidase inhibitor Kazal type 13 transcript variant 2 n=1 Tax=Homo sapiens TaxID=9606 RepID=A0A9E8LN19_HUMAN|nr:serine peptidase inhibitor Kazal type 13 transcript variant 2 [Homo sapiens]UZY20611.1 serine peptidase inhibitor Kazal type 13 transcript variant 3 [Homo sapiens]
MIWNVLCDESASTAVRPWLQTPGTAALLKASCDRLLEQQLFSRLVVTSKVTRAGPYSATSSRPYQRRVLYEIKWLPFPTRLYFSWYALL